MNTATALKKTIQSSVILLLGASLLIGCTEQQRREIKTASSQAKPYLLEKKWTADVGIINDQPDAGVRVMVKVRNTGKRGLVGIKALVTCSEGEWSRNQHLTFNAGEVKTLTFFFHEPTVNASNIQVEIKLSP
ncbi:MAG: hypothetical protein Tsb009_07280 [Planctomycetaceae bacterium]